MKTKHYIVIAVVAVLALVALVQTGVITVSETPAVTESVDSGSNGD